MTSQTRIDQLAPAIVGVAREAREKLARHGRIIRDLEPGDSTRYRLLIVHDVWVDGYPPPIGKSPVSYVALLNFPGIPSMEIPGYVARRESHISDIDVRTYFTENGRQPCSPHTAAVVALFINELFEVAGE